MRTTGLALVATCLSAVSARAVQMRIDATAADEPITQVYPPPDHRLLQLSPTHLEWVPECLLNDTCGDSQWQSQNSILKSTWEHLLDIQPFTGFIDVTADYDASCQRSASAVRPDNQLVMGEVEDGGVAVYSNGEPREFLMPSDDVMLWAAPQAALNAAPFPDAPMNADTVNKLMPQLNQQNLGAFINEIVATFTTRRHTVASGIKVGAWVAAKFQAILDEAGVSKDVAGVRLFVGRSSKQPNVVATIYGTAGSDEYVVIGAHEDSTAQFSTSGLMPGADDDASGLACVLEIFRVLVKSGFRPKHSIQFMAYAGEEAGLLGSKDIARDYRSNNVKVKGMLQMEMAGYHPARSSGFVTVMKDSDEVMGRYIHMLASAYLLGGSGVDNEVDSGVNVRYSNCGYGCSDHYSWTAVNYPAVALAEAGPRDRDLNPNIHTTGDTPDKLDMAYLLNFARVGLAFAVELSSV